jgi:thiamine biosynthesis lipoprotein ApbE
MGYLSLIGGADDDAAKVGGEFRWHYENVMGTSLELRVRAEDENQAKAVEQAALQEIDRLCLIFDGYRPESELSSWSQGVGELCRVSTELAEVLRKCDAWREASRGAFDPRAAVYGAMWANAARTGVLPDENDLAASRTQAIKPAWWFDANSGFVMRTSACPISLNAIAKGYIVEKACEAAHKSTPGVTGVLLNVGGDLCVRGNGFERIGLAPSVGDSESADAELCIAVRDLSVATSGRAQRGFKIKDRWYSHVIDPRTGMPASEVASATVVARGGADADALATICNVLDPQDSLKLIEAQPDTACRIELRSGAVFESNRWAPLVRAASGLTALREDPPRKSDEPKSSEEPKQKGDGKAQSGWSDDHELNIEFQINRPESERSYRRPYVVIWIEDERGESVRTLLLWVSLGGSGPDRWLPDLARWYRGDKHQNSTQRKNMVYTMGRPTRQPGQYNVSWDGKDDAGKPVAAGTYTLLIESAREHGTHQLIRKQVRVGSLAFREEVEGNVEIKSAVIEYRSKGETK